MPPRGRQTRTTQSYTHKASKRTVRFLLLQTRMTQGTTSQNKTRHEVPTQDGRSENNHNTRIIALTSTRCRHLYLKVRKNANIRNPYNQIPHLTQNIIWKSDKNTRNHHIQESQKVKPFPAGDRKAARNRLDILTRARDLIFFTTDLQTVNYYSTIHALKLIYFLSMARNTNNK